MSNQEAAARPAKPPPLAGQKRKDAPSSTTAAADKRARTNKNEKTTQRPHVKSKGGQTAGQTGKQTQPATNKRRRTQKDARTLVTQTTSKAFKNGELDVDKFVKAREFEIRALQDGLERSRLARNQRAFQTVPRDMRRRTGAWDVKRLPKKKRPRAAREIYEDNTPTGKARKKKLTGHMHLRQQTIKRLRALGAKRKAAKDSGENVEVLYPKETPKATVKTRDPRIKKNVLSKPPVAKARFRKRQVHKTWLPTHMFHAKRAHMSSPTDPVWRFAMPMSPTAKSYRPTHAAASQRGAVAWDVSYMATISLEGGEASLLGLLRGLHATLLSGAQERLWLSGTRSWQGWLFTREDRTQVICPVAIIWRSESKHNGSESGSLGPDAAPATSKPPKRRLFVRAHPASFQQLWEEVVRLCKVQKPQVSAEDLRYEIGSIEILGPGATEALQAVLWPSPDTEGGDTWRQLEGLDSPGSLGLYSVLSFEASDPRLHHPPRTIECTRDSVALLQSVFEFDKREKAGSQSIFDSRSRRAAISSMQSQQAINRRKAKSVPGEYVTPVDTDPRIPVMLIATPFGTSSSSQRNTRMKSVSWTLVLPWKAVQAVWLSIMFCPLSTGGQPRLGGLDQQRQLAFEHGTPWWPGDFPGTAAGDAWNEKETAERKRNWERRPRSRRVAFDTLDLGKGQKGEVGDGWDLPFHLLSDAGKKLQHVSSAQARILLREPSLPDTQNAIFIVRITLFGRGTPSPGARIYALPQDPTEQEAWTAQSKPAPKKGMRPASRPPLDSRALLAQELLYGSADGTQEHPPCPLPERLMGFVTSGAFNLREGKGTGIASLGIGRVRSLWSEREPKRCIVRNAGETIGRLASWEVV